MDLMDCSLPFLLICGVLLCRCHAQIACLARANYAPSETIGNVLAGEVTLNSWSKLRGLSGIQAPVGGSSPYTASCCISSDYITAFNVSVTASNRVGEITANCSGGETLSLKYGYGTSQIGSANWNGSADDQCQERLVGWQSISHDGSQGVFPFDAGDTMDSFLGVGMVLRSRRSGVISCPFGTRPVGIGARSSCYSLTQIRIVCTETGKSDVELKAIPDSCPNATAHLENGTSVQLGNPEAWYSSVDQQKSGNSSKEDKDCCPINSAIANWTIAPSEFNTNDTAGHKEYVGEIQGVCTDGTVLSQIGYGYNLDQTSCAFNHSNGQQLGPASVFSTPSDGKFYFSYNTSNGNGALNSFMFGPKDNYITCPRNQQAVGYSVQRGCYSLTNLKVYCRDEIASSTPSKTPEGGTAQEPYAIAKLCPGGQTTIPGDQFQETFNRPLGAIANWTWGSAWTGMVTNVGSAGDFMLACCPDGQAIEGFNVWPRLGPFGQTWNRTNNVTGQIQATCRGGSSTNMISINQNGTMKCLANQSAFDTSPMQTRKLNSGNQWTVRADMALEQLMGLPKQDLSIPNSTFTGPLNVSETNQTLPLSCPNGQKPLGFGARSNCNFLSDFRVICGIPIPPPQTGLSPGETAGTAIGSVVGGSLIFAGIGFLVIRKRKRDKQAREHIDARLLFNYNGVDGFYTGTSDGSHKKLDISALSSLRFGERTMEELDTTHSYASNLEGIPEEWQIKPNEVKIHCVDSRPIELGRGGFGTVLYGRIYREDAAIKLLARKDIGDEKNMLREIIIMDRARSEYVVRFLGYCFCSEGILLAMEFMPNGTLQDALDRNDQYQWYNWGQKAIMDIANGLFSLHSKGIMHLDLKPANILLADDGKAKISDLGLGRLLTGNTDRATAVGTFMYMSHEQLDGQNGLECDIYSFSIILWQVCTLRKPERNVWAVSDITPADAPQAVKDLALACQRKDPKARPTIAEVCDTLDKIQRESVDL